MNFKVFQLHCKMSFDMFKMVFEATRGTNYRGDIAVDDVVWKTGSCGGKLIMFFITCIIWKVKSKNIESIQSIM